MDGLDRYLPAPLRGITDTPVALKDFQLVGDQIKTAHLKIGAPTTRTVNGQLDPRIRIRPGETQLWRLANIGANISYKVTLPGTKFHIVAQDGCPVNRVYSVDAMVIPAVLRRARTGSEGRRVGTADPAVQLRQGRQPVPRGDTGHGPVRG